MSLSSLLSSPLVKPPAETTQTYWTEIKQVGHIDSPMNPKQKPVSVIACSGLALDCKKIAAEATLDLPFHFLPGGLHRAPAPYIQ